ncbi:phosphoribosylformylglycinamidine synthase [Clostridium sp. JN-9]|uniref:phosphoribosylformylglycinamidine synthase n=1 Tax=Clostridium sp. JN-9 TaxID=2507159 RepID=UPI000FFE09A5|nr:phosphoribosylformylglycinamidine synthase [Clostridium sp. JN-9]QAT40253.1 phosphoribosylformylglycinamidine synthase [Clostridium sp. JN-9]
MKKRVNRIFVRKKPEYAVESHLLLQDLKLSLHLENLDDVKIINRYDIQGISDEEYEISKKTIFSEPNVDFIYEEKLPAFENSKIFASEYLPGQYDQRSDSASQCLQILTKKEDILVKYAKVFIITGNINDEEFNKIRQYCINPVDSREASLVKPDKIENLVNVPETVETIENFISLNEDELNDFYKDKNLAMSFSDLKFVQSYFKSEKRNPTITEIKVIDTYWSDHCRHTTFMTEIDNVEFSDDDLTAPIKNTYKEYINSRDYVYGDKNKPKCLMDLAVICMKELRKKGLLDDLEESEEINACSIEVEAEIDGKKEKWLVMFKNETHNHPTEIEPFGGAATCLGGAIRDPLSGRSYVYQAMRVTGSGDPTVSLDETLPGKLPQKKITLGAAQGYSSYGNQIGIATGCVHEVYHPGYVAKRMEVGAVIGAAPKKNVIREEPVEGDIIILVGGRTGRDGCGGATGSSKKHTECSLESCGAEVQKGNAPTERKIQRLFRNEKVSKLIKRCNDFGAGGVSVAIGELSDGLKINLDVVPKKYEGLDGTELAISESQERMAVVVSKDKAEEFIHFASLENLEATIVAQVTKEKRLKMYWNGTAIVDISRDFLNTNGVRQKTDVFVKAPSNIGRFFKASTNTDSIKDELFNRLSQLNGCSEKGLVERFDSTIGAGTVIMPYGGKYQRTPSEAMVAKLPVRHGNTTTATAMAYGFNPYICELSPYHGAVYSVIESVCKIVAAGGNYKNIKLTLQEYFEKLGTEPETWGKPFAALLGAYKVQRELGIAAIGGKDSMSGSFNDLDVPPSLVSFSVGIVNSSKAISPEFEKLGSKIVYIPAEIDEHYLPDFNTLKTNLDKVSQLINDGKVISAQSIKNNGILYAITLMCFGNKIGFNFTENIKKDDLFNAEYGAFILEFNSDTDIAEELKEINYKIIGSTQSEPFIEIGKEKISIDDAYYAWSHTLEDIFKTESEKITMDIEDIKFEYRSKKAPYIKIAKPRVFIPAFPGTNCEYDSEKAFINAGAEVNTFIFRNLSSQDVSDSIKAMAEEIKKSQIIMIPGGFSAGDEPDGSGKFIANVFRNSEIKEAVMELLKNRDGLILGICNGFQALIKLGLVPYGEITDIDEDSPTLTYNKIGRHVSTMVNTKVTSVLSPWLSKVNVGDIHTIPVSHGEGRFVASQNFMKKLIENGQIATQYVDFRGHATYDINYNPNGSYFAVEGITSPDGRIFGKMAHSERMGIDICRNIPGNKDQKIFQSGVEYFK